MGCYGGNERGKDLLTYANPESLPAGCADYPPREGLSPGVWRAPVYFVNKVPQPIKRAAL